MAKRRSRKQQQHDNSQGFINTYNAGQHTGAYGSPAYANNFDPTQGFGTPQPAQPPPPSWEEQQAQIIGNRNVGLADANATYQHQQIGQQFGYGADGKIDPTNPYSLAALNERSFAQSRMGDRNAYASQGNLYAGSYQNAVNEREHQHSLSVNQLQNQYAAAQHGVTTGQLSAYANAGSTITDAQWQALLAKITGK